MVIRAIDDQIMVVYSIELLAAPAVNMDHACIKMRAKAFLFVLCCYCQHSQKTHKLLATP